MILEALSNPNHPMNLFHELNKMHQICWLWVFFIFFPPQDDQLNTQLKSLSVTATTQAPEKPFKHREEDDVQHGNFNSASFKKQGTKDECSEIICEILIQQHLMSKQNISMYAHTVREEGEKDSSRNKKK